MVTFGVLYEYMGSLWTPPTLFLWSELKERFVLSYNDIPSLKGDGSYAFHSNRLSANSGLVHLVVGVGFEVRLRPLSCLSQLETVLSSLICSFALTSSLQTDLHDFMLRIAGQTQINEH